MGIHSINLAYGASYGAYNQKLTQKTREKLEAIIEKSYASYWKKKRLFDIFFATLILLFLSMLMPNLGHAFDIDETVDDQIRKNYNPNQLVNDVGINNALEKNIQSFISINEANDAKDMKSFINGKLRFSHR